MSTIVDATAPATEFALPDVTAARPDTTISVVRLVTHGIDGVMPFVQATCEDPTEFRDLLGADPTTRCVDLVETGEHDALFRVRWEPWVDAEVSLLASEGATLLDATVREGTWQFRVLFPDHDDAAETRAFCADSATVLEANRIDCLSAAPDRGWVGLTERQHETLARAYESGYYDVPRTVTQTELAAQFGISHQALSERLRRAHARVVASLYGSRRRADRDTGAPVRAVLDD